MMALSKQVPMNYPCPVCGDEFVVEGTARPKRFGHPAELSVDVQFIKRVLLMHFRQQHPELVDRYFEVTYKDAADD